MLVGNSVLQWQAKLKVQWLFFYLTFVENCGFVLDVRPNAKARTAVRHLIDTKLAILHLQHQNIFYKFVSK